MAPSRRIIAAGLLLLALSCRTISLRSPFAHPTPSPAVFTQTPPSAFRSTPTPPVLRAESISPIPIHVGHAIRGSWFEIYFTDPADPASARTSGGVDRYISEAIDAARLSVHAAVYNLTLRGVGQALIRAQRRGLDVRLVTESDNWDSSELQRLIEAGIPILGDRRQGSMHDKFMIIDGLEVWTGSLNYTTSGVYSDNNAVMHISSADLAANYETEFAERFEDDVFGPEPGRPSPRSQMLVSGTLVESYFAPDDDVERILDDLLRAARSSVYFMAYSFTDNVLGAALVRLDAGGADVRGVLDEDQGVSNLGTELVTFRSEEMDIRLDGNRGQMHEKVLVIDGEVTVVGSYNFSRNASETNDENVLIIHNRVIARQFIQEFERIYALAIR